MHIENAHEHTGSAEAIRPSLHGGLRLTSRSPRRPGSFATVASGNSSANLTPASGCQDHTTSPSASVPFVNGTSTSTASHPAFVTIAIRPSSGTRQWAYTTDLGRTASVISEIPKLGAVARMEPTGRRKAPPDGAIRDSTRAAKIPEFAEPVIGRAFARPVGSVRATTLDGILVICPDHPLTRQLLPARQIRPGLSDRGFSFKHLK